MFYVGIDVGGTGLKAGVVNEEGKIISTVPAAGEELKKGDTVILTGDGIGNLVRYTFSA